MDMFEDKPGLGKLTWLDKKIAVIKQSQGEPGVHHWCLKFCPDGTNKIDRWILMERQ